ncbi:MAG: 1-acyl-sn-glycerol-3-phosphate acyltransferase, partial [Bacteroidota bacterium]
MLYYLLRPITTIALCVFFRKIYITGTENLPQRGPVVFAINHPTAFIDPLPITCFFYRFITHFILRGDMFNSKAVTWALESIKTVPIYRFRDGFDNLRKNQETMERMEQLLANNGNIIIMAEGIRKHEKRMRPIQKGTARMVFGSYGKYQNDEIQIVPVGINFTNALKERSVLMYDFGQPLSIKDYIADYEKNDRRAIKRLTDDISKGMKPRIIHVDNPDDDALADDVLDLFRNDRVVSRSPFLSNDRSLLESELQIIQRFNNLGDAQNTMVHKTMIDYQQTLEQHR